jgi:hypothetical protein
MLDVRMNQLDANAISDMKFLESVHNFSLCGWLHDSDPCPLR